MNALELKQLLAQTPDVELAQLPVMVMMPNPIRPGMFAFANACICESGPATLPAEQDEPEMRIFGVFPHGYGQPEEESPETKPNVELN